MFPTTTQLPAWRRLLRPLAAVYGWAVELRNRRYDAGPPAVQRAGVPVISIGNITTGGTGKTPLVIEVVRMLQALGRRPAILTRGYGARAGQTPDEVAEFHHALPQVPVVVDADRVRGARTAVAGHAADVLVLDDGFQHRRLARDLDIVLIDALDPWGGEALLPAGRLREPLTSLARANLFVITRANQVEPAVLARIDDDLHDRCPAAPRVYCGVQAERLVGLGEQPRPLDDLGYHNVLPVCGIGNPETFLRLLGEHAGRCTRPLVYADHHSYSARDAAQIRLSAAARQADLIVTTRKDWSKLEPLWELLPATAPAAGSANPDADLVRMEIAASVIRGRAALEGALAVACGVGAAVQSRDGD